MEEISQSVTNTLIELGLRDQEMRLNPEVELDPQVDKENTEKLKEIIKHIGGWPTVSLVGEEASYAAWYLVQHADLDIEFQKYCLELMNQEKDDVAPENIAYLTDRVLINEDKRQIYGTQFRKLDTGVIEPFPIKNPDNLEARRKGKGLEPFSIHFLKIKGEYKWPEGYKNPKVGRFNKVL